MTAVWISIALLWVAIYLLNHKKEK